MSLEEELREAEERNKCYYKIIQRGDLLGVCELQWFDEYDYNQDRFLTDEDGCQYQFVAEDEAKKWLNNNIKPEYVDPDDKILNNVFNRKKYFKNYED